MVCERIQGRSPGRGEWDKSARILGEQGPEEVGVKPDVADIELDVRRGKGHAAEDLRAEEPHGILQEPRPELDWEKLDLILNGELAVRRRPRNVVLVQLALPPAALGGPVRADGVGVATVSGEPALTVPHGACPS
jgi:hypothetical protein